MYFPEYAARASSLLDPATAPWSPGLAPELDLDQAVESLRRRYPGLCIYWGEYTGSLWALLPDQLVEAKNAHELARRIDLLLEHPARRSPRNPRNRPEVTQIRAPEGAWGTSKAKAPTAGVHSWVADPVPRRRQSSLFRRLVVGCLRIWQGQPQLAPSAR